MKTKFFSNVKKSIFNIEDYQEFSTEKIGKSITYILKLMLLFTIIVTAAISYRTYRITKDIYDKTKKSSNYFYIENNKLISESEYEEFKDAIMKYLR